VIIEGRRDRNRAFDGDTVAVRLYERPLDTKGQAKNAAVTRMDTLGFVLLCVVCVCCCACMFSYVICGA